MTREHTDPEVIVHISVRLPNTHRDALAALIAPLMQAAVAVGGHSTNVHISPYDPDEPEEDL